MSVHALVGDRADAFAGSCAPARADEKTSTGHTPPTPRPPPVIRVISKTSPMATLNASQLASPQRRSDDDDDDERLSDRLPQIIATPSTGESCVPSLSALLRRQFVTFDPARPAAPLASRVVAAAAAWHPARTTRQLAPLEVVSGPAPEVVMGAPLHPPDASAQAVTHYETLTSLSVPQGLDTTFTVATASPIAAADTEANVGDDHDVNVDSDAMPSPKMRAGAADELALSECGFFRHYGVVDKYSLLELYRIRCWQLGVKRPDPRVEAQLPTAIGRAVAANVPSIDLSATYVGSLGCLALAAVIPFCTSLRSLTLSGVGLVENSLAVYALLHACRCCPTLLFLDLSLNRLGDVAGRWLLQLCQARPSLRVVRLEQAHLSAPLMQKLQRRLQKRDSVSGSTAATVASPATTEGMRDESFTPTPPPPCSNPASPPQSTASSWRHTPQRRLYQTPHRVASPTPSTNSARSRLSYATPVRTRDTADDGLEKGRGATDDTAYAIGYELLGSAGSMSRLGRSSRQSSARRGYVDRDSHSATPTTPIPTPPPPSVVVTSVLFPSPSADATVQTLPDVDTDSAATAAAAAAPAEVAAWIRAQRAKDKVAASLQNATNEELYDHGRQEDLDHASHSRVPDFVAAALVELRRRLARNGHAMQRIYECFLLPEEFEAQIKMGRAGMTADPDTHGQDGTRLTRPQHATERRRRQRDILRSAASQQSKTEALVHMELLRSDNVSPELVRQVQQGVCSWKAFFRGLRILGIDSAATNLQQATRFASVCGILTADHVCFGKLIRLLRLHVAFRQPATSVRNTADSVRSDGASSAASPLRRRVTAESDQADAFLPVTGDNAVSTTRATAPSAMRARVMTWDVSAPKLDPSLRLSTGALADSGTAPNGSKAYPLSRDLLSASPATEATVITSADSRRMSAVAPITASAVHEMLDKLYDARNALRRALAAITVDPNHYSTMLFQSGRSQDFANHDCARSDEWIFLERAPMLSMQSLSQQQPPASLPARASLCQWPQTNLLDRSLDTAVDVWRRNSLGRSSVPFAHPAPGFFGGQSVSQPEDVVRMSVNDLTAVVRDPCLSPLNERLGLASGADLARPLPVSEAVALPVIGGTTTSSLIVPYSSVLQTCLALLGPEQGVLIRTTLYRIFTGRPLFSETVDGGDDDADGAACTLAFSLTPFADDDDRLVDVENDLLQCLTLREAPPAPPADEERADWRQLNVAELQRMIDTP